MRFYRLIDCFVALYKATWISNPVEKEAGVLDLILSDSNGIQQEQDVKN